MACAARFLGYFHLYFSVFFFPLIRGLQSTPVQQRVLLFAVVGAT